MRNKGARGLSLAEIIVAMALLGFLISISSYIFVSAWRRYHVSNALQDVQFNAVRGVDLFSLDLTETSFSNVSTTRPNTWTFPSARDLSGIFHSTETGPLWSSWYIYHLVPDGQRKAADGSSLYFLARTQVEGDLYATFSVDTEIARKPYRVMARNVKRVQVEVLPLTTYYKIRMETENDIRGKPCTFNAQRDVVVHSP
ncbi:MAG: type II secretion system protein [Candidatus Eremiobacteraeota bacterium]|nr:type II secretion system protein [Candidatus Eremiobacteraeota bacterium]